MATAGNENVGNQIGKLVSTVHDVRARYYDRLEAVSSLARLVQNGQCEPSILSGLLAEQDPWVRAHVARESLRNSPGASDAMGSLLKDLASDREDDRDAAAAVLGELGDTAREAVPSLIAAMARDGVDSVAASSLVDIGRSAVPPLIAAMADSRAVVRAGCLAALRLIGAAGEVPSEVLENAIKDTDLFVRRQAVDAIGCSGQPPDVVGTLLTAALKDEDAGIRQRTLVLLSKYVANKAVTTALINSLNDSDPTVRRVAAEALGTLDRFNNDVVSSLLEKLNDDNAGVARAAKRAVDRILSYEIDKRTGQRDITDYHEPTAKEW